MPRWLENTYDTTQPMAIGTTAPAPKSSTPMIVQASGVLAAPANTAATDVVAAPPTEVPHLTSPQNLPPGTTDNPDHDRLRRAIAPAFTPAAIRRLEERLGEFVTPGLDTLAVGDVVDMVQALTVPLPVSAIAVLLGVDRSRWQDFREWSNDVTTLFGVRTPTDLTLVTGRALPNILALRNLIDGEMRTRTEESDDILALLRRARTERLMSPVEALSAAMLLLVAGNETTTNLLGSILIALAGNPDLYTRLRADRTLIPRAIEEGLRWGSPVQWVARTALAPYTVGDAVIPARSRVVLFYAGANRDPARFDNPDEFDIDRKA